MTPSRLHGGATGALAGLLTLACASAPRAVPSTGPLARGDGGFPPHTAADVHFMTSMIPHHAQAVLMAGWAPTHDAGPAIRVLCERIVVAQRDEIASMQRWLRARGEPVPAADAQHGHGGTLLPGMLTPAELAELDAARGPAFDRLFLRFMILHHEGALIMVDQLFASHGAAQDDEIFRFAVDVHADQSAEIDRMQLMLAAMSSDPSPESGK